MAVDRSQRIKEFLEKLPDVKPKRASRPAGIDEKLFQAFRNSDASLLDCGIYSNDILAGSVNVDCRSAID